MAALTKERYFEAALDIIASDGFEALTITKLCERLDVTIGSFYHHFKGSKAFLQAFYEYWETAHAYQLIEQVQLEDDPAVRFALLKKLSAGLPHAAEAAIRARSRTHPDAAAAQRRVDEARVEVVFETLRRLGVPSRRAKTLAVMAVAVLVGAQQMGEAEDPALMRKVFDELEAWLTGTASG
jgi:AcrR family transcriptional regulator